MRTTMKSGDSWSSYTYGMEMRADIYEIYRGV
jgi:hypothetical protein